MISEAMQVLYAGDRERGEALLEPGEESIFEAAAFGRVARLEELLSEEPELARAWSEDGFTALHLACFAGGVDATRLLVERGADLEPLSTASFAKGRPLGTAAFARDTRARASCWRRAPIRTAPARAASRRSTPLRRTATPSSSGCCLSTAPTPARRLPTAAPRPTLRLLGHGLKSHLDFRTTRSSVSLRRCPSVL